MKYIKYGHGKWVRDHYGATESTFKAYKPAGLSQFYKILLKADAYHKALQEAFILLKTKNKLI